MLDPQQLPDILRSEYLSRKKSNPAYSQRAFARDLGLPSGRLSEIFSGRRKASVSVQARIVQSLALSAELKPSTADDSKWTPYREMDAETLKVLSDWQHFAIFTLMETGRPPRSTAEIAERLSISRELARSSVRSLVKLRMLTRKTDGSWAPCRINLKTSQDIASRALKESHRQSMGQAIEALNAVELELRDISSMTMAIDLSKIPQAKLAIRAFRRRMAKLLEKGQRTEVYNLNVQLVPVKIPKSSDKT